MTGLISVMEIHRVDIIPCPIHRSVNIGQASAEDLNMTAKLLETLTLARGLLFEIHAPTVFWFVAQQFLGLFI